MTTTITKQDVGDAYLLQCLQGNVTLSLYPTSTILAGGTGDVAFSWERDGVT